MTASTYHPSGRVPHAGFHALGVAGLAAVGSALVYAWLMAYLRPVLIPDLKPLLAVFALLGACVWMCVLTRRVAAAGRIRNPDWMARAAAGLGLLAWYVQWAAYIVMEGARSGGGLDVSALAVIADLCFRPEALFHSAFIAPLANESMPMQGGMVFCWCVEFYLHVLQPARVGRKRAGMPFCEASGQWAQKIEVETDFEPFADLEAAQRMLEAEPRRFADMLVPRAEDAVGSYTRVTLFVCTGPESFITISHCEQKAVENIPLPPEVVGAMAAGASEVECYWEQPIVELLRVPLPDSDALLRRWSAACQDVMLGLQ